jgi:hypothetical protein
MLYGDLLQITNRGKAKATSLLTPLDGISFKTGWCDWLFSPRIIGEKLPAKLD